MACFQQHPCSVAKMTISGPCSIWNQIQIQVMNAVLILYVFSKCFDNLVPTCSLLSRISLTLTYPSHLNVSCDMPKSLYLAHPSHWTGHAQVIELDMPKSLNVSCDMPKSLYLAHLSHWTRHAQVIELDMPKSLNVSCDMPKSLNLAYPSH